MEGIILNKSVISQNSVRQKRPCNPLEWKTNQAKKNRNRGSEYVSSSTGARIPAKIPPQGGKCCWVGCHFAACNIDDEQRQNIFGQYYSLGEYNMQRTYLLGLMEKQEGNPTFFKYYLNINGKKTQVCKTTFTSVHQISKKIVENVQNKIREGKLAVHDNRGLHNNRPRKVTEEIKGIMRAHILGFTMQPIHYSRQNDVDLCLPSHFTVSSLFRDFETTHPDIPDVNKKETIYREVFKATNIKISQPRSDTCKTCDLLRIRVNHGETLQIRQHAVEELKTHQIRAESGYQSLYADIEISKLPQNETTVLCSDLQQVLFTPTLTHQDMFYLRQFSTYNLGIYDGGSDEGYMYLWNETDAKRGVNEMSSALMYHIFQNYHVLDPGSTRKLIFWSDRCRGQYNNFYMLLVFRYLMELRYFTEIEQKFLYSGHSYHPCDRLFALIEKQKRVSAVFVPDQWKDVMLRARPAKPFHVMNLPQDRIFDVKSFEISMPRPATLKVTEIMRFLISADQPDKLLTRQTHDDDVWICHQLYTTARDPLIFGTVEVDLIPCYNALLPISLAKKQNLRSMLPFLQPEYRPFYENIIALGN